MQCDYTAIQMACTRPTGLTLYYSPTRLQPVSKYKSFTCHLTPGTDAQTVRVIHTKQICVNLKRKRLFLMVSGPQGIHLASMVKSNCVRSMLGV